MIPNGINETHFSGVPTPLVARQALDWPDALVLGFTGFVRDLHGVDRVVRWMATAAAPASVLRSGNVRRDEDHGKRQHGGEPTGGGSGHGVSI